MSKSEQGDEEESGEVRNLIQPWYIVVPQVAIPFFLASMGTITAGIILGTVQHWKIFQKVTELFILVPALCGLKGNLDMCVASRLSTHSNLGHLRNRRAVQHIVIGNLILVQIQAIICAFLLGCGSVVIKYAVEGNIQFEHLPIVLASALFTASTSCFILDSVLMGVIIFSQKYKFNPDYMATPLVASIGDVISISMLAFSAAFIDGVSENRIWIPSALVVGYLALLPLWTCVVLRNIYTRHVLKYGWIPVIGALCISIGGGLVLSEAVEDYGGFALFSPIINGIGGNMASVLASFMGSVLYARGSLGVMPEDTRICERPDRILIYGTIYASVSRILIIVSIPGNIIIISIADYLYKNEITVFPVFAAAFSLVSLILLIILLWLAHIVVHTMWKLRLDPDSSSIPYLTAVGDVLGVSLLFVMFNFLKIFDQEYKEKSNG